MRNPSIASGLRIQARVIGALLLREMITRFGRSGIGILWLIVEPMLFIVTIAAIWYLMRFDGIVEISAVSFAVTGYSCYFAWHAASNRCTAAISSNKGLMFHRNVKVIDIFISRVLLELSGATSAFALLTIIFVFFGLMDFPVDLVTVLGGWLLIAWFAFALGFIVGPLTEKYEIISHVWRSISRLMLYTSGTMYLVDWLPSKFQELVLYLPMVHGVEMVRHGFWGDAVPTHENPGYFAICNSVLTIIGIALVRVSEREAETL